MAVKLKENWIFAKIKKICLEFPSKFWLLVGSSFIDGLGRTVLVPFFALYITQKFNVGMTEAGVLLAILSIMGVVGSLLGGALSDKFGHKLIIVSGLILSAFSSFSMGIINNLILFYIAAFFIGILSNIGGPAQQAMIADFLPEEKRAEGFGLFRIINNFAWIIGPTIGGFLISKSYFLIFASDAILSTITALIILKFISDKKSEKHHEKSNTGFLVTLAEYKKVIKNTLFITFLGMVVLMVFVFQHLYTTLSVYLRDVHQVSESGFGTLISTNAFLVVLFQFLVTRIIRNRNPYLMMSLGTIFYFIGFTSFGFFNQYILFMAATVIITIGEMITIPVQQTLVAKISPKDMMGRYMAVSSFSYTRHLRCSNVQWIRT